MESAPAAADEINSARQVFRELDKTCRATRTYGLGNAVTKRFFEQLNGLMLSHLESWPVLAVIVERAELRLYEEPVYKSEDSVSDSLAFRLFGDGVREVRFEHGLSPEELHDFVDALWGQPEGEDADDDVVTRLWDKDLATISFLTAEDIVQAPWTPELTPQEHGFFASPPASFHALVEQEKSRAAAGGGARPAGGPPAAGENLKPGGGLLGYEVTDADRAAVADELDAERGMDQVSYLLAMLKVILECETTADVLSRGLSVVPGVIDALLTEGNWPSLTELLAVLEGVAEVNPDFEPTHRMMTQRVLGSLSMADHVALMEKGLNAPAAKPLASLLPVLARLDEHAVGPLCGVLAGVTGAEPRAILRETLVRLARGNPDPVLKGLADERPAYVRDLIAVITAWQLPQTAEVLALVAHHPAPEVRADAISAIARVHPTGDGGPLIAFAGDHDDEVRQHALRTLASGRYTASFDAWKPQLEDREAIVDRERAEKRLLFQALRATAGDGAVPFWEELLVGRGWKQRAKKEETALLAVKMLGALGTPRAKEALELGQREASGPVRKACAAELGEKS